MVGRSRIRSEICLAIPAFALLQFIYHFLLSDNEEDVVAKILLKENTEKKVNPIFYFYGK